MGHAGTALVPSSPPPALLISSTGGNKSQQGVLLAWRQHVDTKKMQECPGDLSTQLEGQMGPLSSSKTQRAQLQHPQATILVGGMQFLGGGSDGNPNSPPQPQQQQGDSKPRTPSEEQVAVGQCLGRRHASLGNHQDQLCINIWCMRGWPEPQRHPAARASSLSKL